MLATFKQKIYCCFDSPEVTSSSADADFGAKTKIEKFMIFDKLCVGISHEPGNFRRKTQHSLLIWDVF